MPDESENDMINEFEARTLIEKQLAEAGGEQVFPKSSFSLYKDMRLLIKYSFSKIHEKNYAALRQCFNIASRLYETGNYMVKNAVESVFVYSFTSLLHVSEAEKKNLIALMPLPLYMAYMAQVHHLGC